MGLKIKRMMRYIKNNKWEVFFYLFVVGFIVYIAYYGYTEYQIYEFKNKVSIQKNTYKKKTEKLLNITSDINYQKYQVVKYVENNINTIKWGYTISTLIDIFNTLRNLESGVFSDFQIDLDNINMKGQISSINKMYEDTMILDKFLNLDFIQHLEIKRYEREGNFYEFDLNAKLKINEGESGSK